MSPGRGCVGRTLARGLPVALLVGAQGFRLPLELVMHQAAVAGVMPAQMSFSGWNFGVLTGLAAVVVGALAAWGKMPRVGVVLFNALGTALLVAIIGISVASTPLPHAFGNTPDKLNTWVAYPPFILLPGVMVAFAVLGHVVLWRRLLTGRAPAPVRATNALAAPPL